MAKELVIGLAIGAILKGSFHSSFRTANKTVEQLGAGLGKALQHQERIGNKITQAQTKQIGLQQRISQALLTGDSNANKLIRRYERMQSAIGKAIEKQNQFTTAIRKAEKAQNSLSSALERQESRRQNREKLKGEIVSSTAMTASVVMPAWASVKTFIEQENAATDLKISMMKADRTFGKFNEISKIAGELGKDLPGTRKDFYQLAEALKKQGISDDVLVGGALKTSAELNVLLDIKDHYSGGEFLAKFMESHGLGEKELPQAADYLQRAMFASGLRKEQVYESMKYYAPKVNSLGLTGAENTEKILAIEGMAGVQGLEGSTFGTGFNMMLSRMNKGPKMMRAATKGMKAEAQDMVKAAGVSFNFWDKKGQFKGIDAMLTEMEKFEKIRAKFGDEGVGLVAEELFGIEGGRLADILAKKGKKGLEEMLTKMREQASLQDRIAEKTKTLGAALESLGGVWDSAVGTVGSAFADDIKEFSKWATGLIENDLTPWLTENKSTVKWFVGVAGGLTLMSTAVLATKFAFSGVASVFSAAFMPIRLFKAGKALTELDRLNGKTSQFSKIAKTLGKAFSFIAKGIGIASRALLTSPIFWVVGIVAGAAYLIWDNWATLGPMFANLWQGITEKFDAAWEWIKSAWSGVNEWVSTAWGGVTTYFSTLWESVKTFASQGIDNIANFIRNFDPLALFKLVFESVLNWFGIDLPASFSGFGQMMIDSLVNGIKNAWESVKGFVVGIGESIKNAFSFDSKSFADNITNTANMAAMSGFSSGGFTGAGGKYEPAGIVHKGEYVLTKDATERIGVSNLDRLNYGGQSPQGLFAHYQPLSRQPDTQSSTSGAVTVHFNPTITVTGGQEQSLVGQIQQALLQNSYEFEQMLKRVLDQQQRLAY
ncbi:phage tail tape measure protein [Chelonobacter oris]|uniref:phage tail tape measure protein n=1 Tax=Chelonobacter oris TaxID=505317 RepID=UPI0024476123|nr:phage tail tape measure protein [Chelonobacter oris]MDH2999930.1 phage tail tape measure protein [Chelonobacter oris]